MTVKSRLTEYLDHIKLSQSKFERTCSLSNGFVNNIGKSIRGESLDKISVAFPDLNKSWLMLGEGAMLLNKNPEPIIPNECCPEVNLELEKAYWEIESLQKRIEKLKEDYSQIIEELKGEIKEIKIENKELIRENGSLENQVSTLNKEVDIYRGKKEE